jgi:hypothetical protein
MMDPLSVAAGVIGITAVALHSIRNLKEFIDKISDAPPAIHAITRDLEAVDAVLGTIEGTFNDQRVPDELKPFIDNVKVGLAVKNCGEACEKFEETVTHWMKHSTETKTFWWDKVRAGYFGEAKIKAFTGQLETCKATVNMALGTATLCVLYFLHYLST